MIVLAVLALGGIIFAVSLAPEGGSGTYDANASFDDGNDPIFGNNEADVVIRIFEDFQCPACAVAAPGLKYVRDTYGDRVKVVWNDFPLTSLHPNAIPSANAARCANEQGGFWEYADTLYEQQTMWSEVRDPSELFIAYAKSLGMNEAAFTVCLDERRYNDRVMRDAAEANANRIDSTPTFFINQTKHTGAFTPAQWDELLKPYLGEVSEPAPVEDQPALDLDAEGAFDTGDGNEDATDL